MHSFKALQRLLITASRRRCKYVPVRLGAASLRRTLLPAVTNKRFVLVEYLQRYSVFIDRTNNLCERDEAYAHQKRLLQGCSNRGYREVFMPSFEGHRLYA